jgi:hypothetical protein
MTDKHTSGAWHISKHSESRSALIYDAEGFEVARVCYPNRDANARLIARAPELLAENERLQNLVKKAYLDGWLDGHCAPDGPDAWAENDWQVSEARAALEGRDK